MRDFGFLIARYIVAVSVFDMSNSIASTNSFSERPSSFSMAATADVFLVGESIVAFAEGALREPASVSMAACIEFAIVEIPSPVLIRLVFLR